MIFFAYFRNKVRSMYAWSFALLMLLSSGTMQLNPDITCVQPGYINFIKNKVPPKLPDFQALHCSLLI
ncbi:MAG: hypothetical protein EBV15_06670 [Bacteroidetes bacterium]|nr:hypothetical protein [Bacteroidota bacterium]